MQLATVARKQSVFWLAVGVCLTWIVLPNVGGAMGGAKPTAKLPICHIPPDNPDNFHTITIPEQALPAHAAHGDIISSSCDDAAELVCDDMNACTQDVFIPDTFECVPEEQRETVNCDDNDPSTLDSCDAANGGCENVAIISAESQEVSTGGAAAIDITLQGGAPGGESLAFSILSGPTQGTLGAITPIVQAPVSTCSESGITCVDDTDCGAGETCDTRQPPTTSATVTYTPAAPGALSDAFEFQAAFEGNPSVAAAAMVTINPPPEETVEPPPIAGVEARDGIMGETLVETPVVIPLRGDAPKGVSLTFSVPPSTPFGSLDDLTAGTEAPRRTAAVTYTPEAGFIGAEMFDFEVCDETSPSVCDSATVTVDTNVRRSLATNQTVETPRNQPVLINLGSVQAAVLVGALVAGNVADCEPRDEAENCIGDGLGDNVNDQLDLAPVARAAVGASGGPGFNGTVRLQIEWAVSSIPITEANMASFAQAQVVLTTQKDRSDTLDTQFFVGDASQDGSLAVSDFQAPATELVGAVMPPGTSGTFRFDVTDELKAAILAGFGVFSVQGRVNESAKAAQGLGVFSSAAENRLAGKEPKLELLSGVPFNLQTLPSLGTLTFNGEPVSAGQNFATAPTLLYTPGLGVGGTDSFSFEVTDGFISDIGVVDIIIGPDVCETVGRSLGCSPIDVVK